MSRCFGRRLTHASHGQVLQFVWCAHWLLRRSVLQFVWCAHWLLRCSVYVWMLRRTVALFASHCRASVATSNADYTCGEGGIEDMVAFIVMASLGQFMLCRLSHDILCQISAFIFDVNIHHNLARLRRCCSWRRFIDGARFLEERDTRVISNEILFTLMDYLPSISRSMNRGMNPNCIDPNYTRKPLSLEQSWLLSLLPGVLGDDVLASILHLFGTCVRPHSPPYLTSHHPHRSFPTRELMQWQSAPRMWHM